MPKTRRVLDSSPVAIPSPKKKPIQRSASIASLPTPPQTRHKRKHSSQTDTDTDRSSNSSPSDTDDLPVPVQDDDLVPSRNTKRRRVRGKIRDDDDDEATFWAGNNTIPATPQAKPTVQDKQREPSPSTPPVPVLFRSGRPPRAPVSPPPSRRRPVTRSVNNNNATTSASSQVEQRSSGPVRDSPNNPFLASLIDSEPRTPTRSSDLAEKPTITYVFRGMKAEFDNPLYQLSPSAHARAALPVEHPEYSPTAACPPRLLFPEAHKARKPQPNPRRRPSSTIDGDDDKTLPRLSFQTEIERLENARSTKPVRR